MDNNALTVPPLVISFSQFAQFKRCKKLYKLAADYDVPSSDAAEDGTTIHEYLAAAALGNPLPEGDDPMYEIAKEYIQRVGFPGETLLVEEPVYTRVLDEVPATSRECFMPAVYVRTTFDRVYSEDGVVVGRDYKSFEKAPSHGAEDWDFQGRLYNAVIMKHFLTDDVRFEWEYIRRELGRNLKGQGYVEWADEERYITVPMVMSPIEVAQLWREAKAVARDILHTMNTGDPDDFYRVDLKTGPHGCTGCFYRELCRAELQHGALHPEIVEMFAKPHDPVARMTAKGIIADPRVTYYHKTLPLDKAIETVYGSGGVALFQGVEK